MPAVERAGGPFAHVVDARTHASGRANLVCCIRNDGFDGAVYPVMGLRVVGIFAADRGWETVRFIPSRLKILALIKSSRCWPLTFSITLPAGGKRSGESNCRAPPGNNWVLRPAVWRSTSSEEIFIDRPQKIGIAYAAVVGEQIADCQFAGDIGIVQMKLGQVLDHRIVQLTSPSSTSVAMQVAVMALVVAAQENGLGIPRIFWCRFRSQPLAFFEDDLAVFDNGQCHTWHLPGGP